MSPPYKRMPSLFLKACEGQAPKTQSKHILFHDCDKTDSFTTKDNPGCSSGKCQKRVVQLSRLNRRSRSRKRETQQPTLPQNGQVPEFSAQADLQMRLPTGLLQNLWDKTQVESSSRIIKHNKFMQTTSTILLAICAEPPQPIQLEYANRFKK